MTPTRAKNATELFLRFGIADECDHGGETLPNPLPRFAIMEADNGPADNGGPWWNFGDSHDELLDASRNQEEPDWWPAEAVFDLDTGEKVWQRA